MLEKLWKGGRGFRDACAESLYFISLALRAFRFWHRDPPLLTVTDLTRFVETRAKFVAQITLFGYIKTRMGTRYASMFIDEVYARSINIAKWEIYLVCLCDAAIYSAASVGRKTGAPDGDMCALALHMIREGLQHEDIPKERPQGFADVLAAFETRARTTAWHAATEGETAFMHSLSALIEWAPIADEFKSLDEKIVRNSMRFKWKSVRDQMAILLDAEAVMADWRTRGNPEPAKAPLAPVRAEHQPEG